MSLAGQKLGQYEIVETLGKGGMGTVYKGYQHSVDRYVAVKVLPPHPGLDNEFRQRFQLEARTIGSLQHPHILSLYDYGSQDDVLYLVMAYADGGTLGDLIEAAPMRLDHVEGILRQLAGALDYAHRRDVVHRDIKPGNILFDSEGNVLLADFGIVKMLSGDGGELTGTAVVGTPAYMAPEQSQGMEIDGRVDIYALGVMVFQMLTGQQPYTSDNPMQLLIKHISDPIPNVLDYNEDLPVGLAPVMKKALAKDPEERYQTGTEFAEAFSKGLHSHDESLADARAAVPLPGDATHVPVRKHKVDDGTIIDSPLPDGTVAGQTIIIQEKSNPAVLLGIAALVALAIVVVAVLVIVTQNDDTPATVADATEEGRPNTPIPAPSEPSFGEVRFTSIENPGDALQLLVKDLQQPGEGQVYVAWLQNTATEETLLLGEIIIDAFGEGSQSFMPELEGMLPAQFNRVALTQEASADIAAIDTPTGDVLYEGTVPIEVTQALTGIFIASEDGLNGGSLLDGAQREASTAANHSGLAARATSVGSMRNHAEHTLNILNGTEEDYDGNGRGQNPGRGVGVYAFLDRIDALLQTAIDAPDAGTDVQINGELIRVCIQNTRDRADRVQALEQELLATEDITSVEAQAAEATELANQLTTGFDANEDGTIQPFEEECGLDQIPDFGVQFGNITLRDVEAEE